MRKKVVTGVAPRFCAASSMLRSKPARLALTRRTLHGMTSRMCPATRAAIEPRIGSSVSDRRLDMEHVERGAEHDAGNDERQQQQVAERLPAPEAVAREAQRRRDADRHTDDRRHDGDLQAQHESVDEFRIVGDREEPFEAVALRRERRNRLQEEGEPRDEDERQQDEAERDAGHAGQRPAPQRPFVDGCHARHTSVRANALAIRASAVLFMEEYRSSKSIIRCSFYQPTA